MKYFIIYDSMDTAISTEKPRNSNDAHYEEFKSFAKAKKVLVSYFKERTNDYKSGYKNARGLKITDFKPRMLK